MIRMGKGLEKGNPGFVNMDEYSKVQASSSFKSPPTFNMYQKEKNSVRDPRQDMMNQHNNNGAVMMGN
jgi:hypothetical protein